MTETERPAIRATIFHESAGAVVLVDGRCLVIRRRDTGQWVLPKGHFDQGERAEDAAVREVREETGLDVRIIGPLGYTRYAYGRRHHNRKRVDWFLATRVGGEVVLEKGFREWALLAPTEAEVTLAHDDDREIVRRAFALGAEVGAAGMVAGSAVFPDAPPASGDPAG